MTSTPTHGAAGATTLDPDRVRQLREHWYALPQDDVSFRWAAYHARVYKCAAEVASILCSEPSHHEWFREGGTSEAAEWPRASRTKANNALRAIECLRRPWEKRKERDTSIPGLRIEQLVRRVPRGGSSGRFDIEVAFGHPPRQLRIWLYGIVAVDLATWGRFRPLLVAHGLLVPNERGYGDAWTTQLASAQALLRTESTAPEASLETAVLLAIRQLIAHTKRVDDWAEYSSETVCEERDAKGVITRLCCAQAGLFAKVRSALPEEPVDRSMVSNAIQRLGGTEYRPRRDDLPGRPRFWAFPPSVLSEGDDPSDPAPSTLRDPAAQPLGGVPSHPEAHPPLRPTGFGEDDGGDDTMDPPGAPDRCPF